MDVVACTCHPRYTEDENRSIDAQVTQGKNVRLHLKNTAKKMLEVWLKW
jgi:hypothetical protein